jgi:transcriptional regulator with XRE-family HTH domain
LLDKKSGERDRVLALFRRGRIDDAMLDKQLDEINAEAMALTTGIDAANRALSTGDQQAQMNSAEALLATLRKRLGKPIPPELKRRIVETLVASIKADTVERWGVPQTSITVTYRFAEPAEKAAAVLPLEHHLTNRTRSPEKLETVGDHIRRRRLTLKLLQRQVAQQIGVNQATITNWETNGAQPTLKYMPAIIKFLGYNPLPPPPSGIGERLVRCRTLLGLSQKVFAGQLGVDQGTLAKWERGEREPAGDFKKGVLTFLNSAEAVWSEGTGRGRTA